MGIYDRHYFLRDVHSSGQAAKLTHLTYAFGELDEKGVCVMTDEATGDAWADYQCRFSTAQSVDGRGDSYEQPLAGNFNQLRKLKKRHRHLKVGISFGGWNASRYFSNAARTPASRAAFASSLVSLYFDGNLPILPGEPQGGPGVAAGIFDYVDFDWEWPGPRATSTTWSGQKTGATTRCSSPRPAASWTRSRPGLAAPWRSAPTCPPTRSGPRQGSNRSSSTTWISGSSRATTSTATGT